MVVDETRAADERSAGPARSHPELIHRLVSTASYDHQDGERGNERVIADAGTGNRDCQPYCRGRSSADRSG
jgi:hypothetical protein